MELDPVERLRSLCLALPETNERLSHGEPSWYIRDKRQFASLDNHHHGAAHLSVWLPAAPGAQETLIESAPERFFRPPYVGHRGWVGVVLDTPDVDWDELEMLIREAFELVAPVTVRRLLSSR